jgi:TPR repeat protein
VRSRALLLPALLAWSGCTPAKPGASIEGPHAETTASGPSASVPEGGAPRSCAHDSKDLAPCVEDCDRGLAFACMLVAMRTERGEGVPRDLTRAVHMHERACELRDASSCVSAARMHASGAGVPPSRAKQVELLATACTLGDVHACSVPAKALANGSGVPRDEARAADLWQRACAGGVETACEALEPEPR